MPDLDVVIVGAGPTGLTTANVLHDHGIRYRIFDTKTGRTTESRALVVQARTLELFQKLGLSDAAVAEGRRANGAVGSVNGRILNHGDLLIDFIKAGRGMTPFPGLLVLEQSKTEQLLLSRLPAGTVEYDTRAEFISQDSDGVHLQVTGPTGMERITARTVIAADGARSPIRHALHLDSGAPSRLDGRRTAHRSSSLRPGSSAAARTGAGGRSAGPPTGTSHSSR